jgi:group II intron reverse transcriptase/maturase
LQIPEVVLRCLAAKEPSYPFKRLYRNLYNLDFYLLASTKLAQGDAPARMDGAVIDGVRPLNIDNTIAALKSLSYQPRPVKWTAVPTAEGRKWLHPVPANEDALVLEVLRMLLEAIYEPHFLPSSHGFRPHRSCHTALLQIKREFAGADWLIKTDMDDFYYKMDRRLMLQILRRKIKDERFIQLIGKCLKAGYLHDWEINRTYSGTPVGGILSPMLANIYLHELDRFVGRYRDACRGYGGDGHGIVYTRYAAAFMIGVTGSKADVRKLQKGVSEFLSKELHLQLSPEQTQITHASEFTRFLGYDLIIPRVTERKKSENMHQSFSKEERRSVKLYVPHERWVGLLRTLGALKINKNGQWQARHRANLIPLKAHEIVRNYHAHLSGLYRYYQLAHNVSVLNKFHYIMKYSCFKTLASKTKTSIRKVIRKHAVGGTFAVVYPTAAGWATQPLYNEGYKRMKFGTDDPGVDMLPDA